MRYMLLLYGPDRPVPGTPEAEDYFGAVFDFHRECRERGVLVSSDPLRSWRSASSRRSMAASR